jgi:hypothetical protein
LFTFIHENLLLLRTVPCKFVAGNIKMSVKNCSLMNQSCVYVEGGLNVIAQLASLKYYNSLLKLNGFIIYFSVLLHW